MIAGPIARGMSLLVGAVTLIPLMDAIAKSLTNDGMAPASVALARFGSQTIVLLAVFAFAHGVVHDGQEATLRPRRLWIHLIRGGLHGASSLTFFVALKYMPLADTIAVFFVEPMILLVLSALFLGEVVGWPRRVAAIVAFGGALLVIQPSYELFGAVALLPLLAALFFALYLMFTSKFATQDHPLTMQLWSGIGASILIGGVLAVGEVAGATDYQVTRPPDLGAVGLIAVIGLVSSVAHLMVVLAFRLAPASVLAPFNYLEIVTATVFGYVLFDDFPGGLQWTGIGIIVAMGLFVFVRERALERGARGAVDTAPPVEMRQA